MITKRRKRKFNTTFFFKKWASYRLYRKRSPRIVNRTVPKIIVISVHTVNRFPLRHRDWHNMLKVGPFTDSIGQVWRFSRALVSDCWTPSEHKLHFEERMSESDLYQTNKLSWKFIVQAYWNKSTRRPTFLFLNTSMCLVEKQQIPILIYSLWFNQTESWTNDLWHLRCVL